MIYVSAFGIVFINAVMKTILRKLSLFEKAHTKTEEIISSTFKMFALQFINTGIVILVVNANIGLNMKGFPILGGEYQEFSVDWYRSIGTTLGLTMLLNVFSPHLSNIMMQIIPSIKRCMDRGCSRNEKNTKQLL